MCLQAYHHSAGMGGSATGQSMHSAAKQNAYNDKKPAEPPKRLTHVQL